MDLHLEIYSLSSKYLPKKITVNSAIVKDNCIQFEFKSSFTYAELSATLRYNSPTLGPSRTFNKHFVPIMNVMKKKLRKKEEGGNKRANAFHIASCNFESPLELVRTLSAAVVLLQLLPLLLVG